MKTTCDIQFLFKKKAWAEARSAYSFLALFELAEQIRQAELYMILIFTSWALFLVHLCEEKRRYCEEDRKNSLRRFEPGSASWATRSRRGSARWTKSGGEERSGRAKTVQVEMRARKICEIVRQTFRRRASKNDKSRIRKRLGRFYVTFFENIMFLKSFKILVLFLSKSRKCSKNL